MGPHGAPGGIWGPLGHLSPELRVGVPRRGEIFHEILYFFLIFDPKLCILANVWSKIGHFGKKMTESLEYSEKSSPTLSMRSHCILAQ